MVLEEDLDDESSIEIELRSTEEIAARIVILAAVIRRSTLELPLDEDDDDEYDDEKDSPEGEQFDILTALRAEPLISFLTKPELALLNSAIGSRGEDVALETFWQIEALAALNTIAITHSPLPEPWNQVDTGVLLASIPEPWDDFPAFARSLEYLDEERVASERERAELWLWRCLVDEELRFATGRDRAELAEVIRETVEEAVGVGILSTGRGDFQVDGRDFAKIDVETKALITEISTQRLRALNWLCGFGESWDSVPLDI